MKWYLRFDELFHFATPSSAVTGADAGGGGAPASGGTPAGSPAAGVGQPGGQPGGQGIEQLRTAYEGIKAKFEPFEKLNLQPDQISRFQGVYEKTLGEMSAIGRQLGYPDDEIVEALLENPIAALDYLRWEQQQYQQGRERGGEADLQERIQQGIEEGLRPVNEWRNEQMTSSANALFERTAYQLAGEHFKKEGLDITNISNDEVDMLLSAASEIMKYDEDALRALKYQGQTAGVQKAFAEAATMLDKYFVARSTRSGAVRPAAGQPNRGTNGQFRPGYKPDGSKASLDDLMNNPELMNPKYAER